MKRNKALIESLTGDLRILDGILKRTDIYRTTELMIDLYIQLPYSKSDQIIKLTFIGIKEFSFYGYLNNFTDYIERYKFFESEKGFYICLDPFSENAIIEPEDQDFILSTGVMGTLFNLF